MNAYTYFPHFKEKHKAKGNEEGHQIINLSKLSGSGKKKKAKKNSLSNKYQTSGNLWGRHPKLKPGHLPYPWCPIVFFFQARWSLLKVSIQFCFFRVKGKNFNMHPACSNICLLLLRESGEWLLGMCFKLCTIVDLQYLIFSKNFGRFILYFCSLE